jgi:hypothetical protein
MSPYRCCGRPFDSERATMLAPGAVGAPDPGAPEPVPTSPEPAAAEPGQEEPTPADPTPAPGPAPEEAGAPAA